MARARVLLSTRSRVEISAIVLRELSVTKIFARVAGRRSNGERHSISESLPCEGAWRLVSFAICAPAQ